MVFVGVTADHDVDPMGNRWYSFTPFADRRMYGSMPAIDLYLSGTIRKERLLSRVGGCGIFSPGDLPLVTMINGTRI